MQGKGDMEQRKREILIMIQQKRISAEGGLELIRNLRSRDPEVPASPRANLKQKSAASPEGAKAGLDIAIIGMSGRFAGAENLSEFWKNLVNGIDSVGEIPADRWDVEKYYHPDSRIRNKTYCKWGGMIADADMFDPLFFNISPVEAEMMDPQQRVLLEESWHAIEDAGYAPDSLSEKKCGVFIGAMKSDHDVRMASVGKDLDAHSITGTFGSFLPARIAYFLNLKGPNVTIDTACSSSLAAIHYACTSIASGESDIALAGGVSILSTPTLHIASAKGEMLTHSGKCRTFDNEADGFVPGEGVGIVVLKALDKALQDGDYIYGFIKGSAVNQDGRTNGITAPSSASQTGLELDVYDRFMIDPETISYVEAHGTGTKLGDPIEVSALTKAFRTYTGKKQYCSIGSVKTNIGHALAAAGVASLIKTLLCMKHRTLVPSLHFNKRNEHIEFESSPFYVNTEVKPWEPEGKKRLRAAISSFGLSGTNCHLVVEEAPPAREENARGARLPLYPVPLSATKEAGIRRKAEDLKLWLEREGTAAIEDISYVLTTGRSHFPVRCIMMVRDRDHLKDTLNAFLRGETPENLFSSPAVREKIGANVLKEMEEELLREVGEPGALSMEAYAKMLTALADLYVRGGDVNWRRFDGGGKLRRVPMPTYPFQRLRCRVEEGSFDTSCVGNAGNERLHPLIGKNTSVLGEQRFTTRFSGEEFYLAHHMVRGKKVLPAVASLEMARAAGELAGGKKVTALSKAVWPRPVVIEDAPGEFHLSLRAQGEGAEYELYSDDANGGRMVHAQGKLSFRDPEIVAEAIDIEAVKTRCTGKKTGKEGYEQFVRMGLEYGPSFRSIKEVYTDGKECLALLQLPDEAKGLSGEFGLHPSLLDGALQALLALFGEEGGEGNLRLPFSLGELEILGPIPEQCYVHATAVGDRTAAADRFDIRLVNGAGRVMVRIKNFSLRTIPASQAVRPPLSAERAQAGIIYCESLWEKSEGKSRAGNTPVGPILLVDNDAVLKDALAARVKRDPGNASEVILVQPGDSFRRLNDRTYEIRPGEGEDYRRLLQELKDGDLLPGAIIHAWSSDCFAVEKVSLDAELAKGIYSLFNLSQALMELKPKGKVRLAHVYTAGPEDAQPHNSAIAAFCRTIRIENPNFVYKTVEINPSLTTQQRGELLLQEFHEGADQDIHIRLDEGARFVWCLKERRPAITDGKKVPVVAGGAYLITGGVGGLGLIFAEYLARRVNARLILTGRSELSEEKRGKLRELEAHGCEVLFIQADISNSEDAERVVREARARFGAINGVIHSAGVIRDALIPKKSREDVASVLAPKVPGTINLDEATRNEPLDFFVLFSSVAAVLGNMGQCDYAYGNAFMDGFARMREKMKRPGKSLSINWPLWNDGGMHIDEEKKIWLERKLGLVPLSTEEGLTAFEEGLAGEGAQVVVMAGDRVKLTEQLGIAGAAKAAAPAASAPTEASREVSLRKVETDLAKMLVGLLKVKESDLDPEEDFSNYGVDSIMMITILNRIEDVYGSAVEPNAIAEYNSVRRLAAHLLDAGVAKPVSSIHQPVAETRGEVLPVSAAGGAASAGVVTAWGDGVNPGHARGPARDARKIAVIGMACRFPQSPSVEAFWENLRNGRNMVTEVPEERWPIADYFSLDRNAPNKSYSKWGGFIDGAYLFDAARFGVTEENALVMDPQHRILLELCEELFCRAGYGREEISNSRTGVFIGGADVAYARTNLGKMTEAGMKHMLVNTIPNMMAARISDFFNLRSPALTMDTACSSSLVAIHTACQSIRNGESDMAVAGGITLLLDQHLHVGFSKASVLSDDGISYVFDEKAKGFVLGEGGGLVLLKGYEAALRDGDRILGVITGSAVNNDGRTMGLTVPNIEAQKEVIGESLRASGATADSIGYLEAHGTGTLLGDPIEIKAATKAYREHTTKSNYCAVGSVKSNIGHLMMGAGVASFIKVLLALGERLIPPTLHCARPHPRFKFDESPFYPVMQLQPWAAGPDARRAAISSFGFGGTNCHMIVEEFADEPACPRTRTPLPLPLFNRKRYRLGEEIVPEKVSCRELDDAALMRLLEEVERGEITSSQALDFFAAASTL